MLRPSLLALDKPVGMRSTKCVEEVRRLLGRDVKVGHGGTLDSTASGLLIVLIDGATRLSSVVMSMPKVYRVKIKIGSETSTCDFTGEEIFSSAWSGVGEEDIDKMLPSFMGWRMQTPPKISAVRVGGLRAHELFRRGGDPKIEPKAVFIEWMERLGPISENGELELRVRCGRGTYIRSIARDIGRALGCGAHVLSLEREMVGCFARGDAVSFSGGSNLDADKLLKAMKPVSVLGDFLPVYSLPDDDMRKLSRGLGVLFRNADRRTFGKFSPRGIVVFISAALLTLARLEERGGAFYALPDVNIAYDATEEIMA